MKNIKALDYAFIIHELHKVVISLLPLPYTFKKALFCLFYQQI